MSDGSETPAEVSVTAVDKKAEYKQKYIEVREALRLVERIQIGEQVEDPGEVKAAHELLNAVFASEISRRESIGGKLPIHVDIEKVRKQVSQATGEVVYYEVDKDATEEEIQAAKVKAEEDAAIRREIFKQCSELKGGSTSTNLQRRVGEIGLTVMDSLKLLEQKNPYVERIDPEEQEKFDHALRNRGLFVYAYVDILRREAGISDLKLGKVEVTGDPVKKAEQVLSAGVVLDKATEFKIASLEKSIVRASNQLEEVRASGGDISTLEGQLSGFQERLAKLRNLGV